jgi:integrase
LTNKELVDSVNPENKALKEDFLTYLRSVDRSGGTIYQYSKDLDIFFVWNKINNVDKNFVKLSKRDFIAFQNWLLTTNENSSARVRRLKATLSSLSNYIENILDDEFPGYRSAVRKIEAPPNVPALEKTVLSEERLEFLLRELTNTGRFQNACAVALAAFSGARKSELLRFKTEFFDSRNIIYGSLYKTPEKIKTKGRGSNGKPLHKFVIADKFKPYFGMWLDKREESGVKSEWLFVSPAVGGGWKQAKPGSLDNWAEANSKILGEPFYFHCLRHFFTSYLSKSGIPDGVIQQIVGWDSADMVKVYNDRTIEDQLSDYFDANGIKDIKGKTVSSL